MFAKFSSILDVLHLGWPLMVPMGDRVHRFLEFAHVQIRWSSKTLSQLDTLGTNFWSACTCSLFSFLGPISVRDGQGKAHTGRAPLAPQLSSSSSLAKALGSWAWFVSHVEGTAVVTSFVERVGRHEADRGFPLCTSANWHGSD